MKNFAPHITKAIKDHRFDCGHALMRCNRHAQAILEFEAVMELEPGHVNARLNRALALLALGNYALGMPEYDWAWKLDSVEWVTREGNKRIRELPLWQGSKCNLIVSHEEGFGDAIMYLRIVPQLVKRCESVTLLVYPELASLMEGYGANIITSVPEDCSKYDAWVSMFNAIWMSGCVTQKTIPSEPYIPSEFKFEGGDKKKMGIAWSGKSQKNFTCKRFLSYLDVGDYELYSLQKMKEEIPGVHSLQADDFNETARLMETLDVIVTVDTSVAHLAGAMGHPNTHVLIPYYRDWRWWHKDWWYPTLKIYPQDEAADWDAPFNRLNIEIHDPSGVRQLRVKM